MPDLSYFADRLIAILCVIARITGFLVLVPVFSSRYIPGVIKAAIGLYFGLVLSPLVTVSTPESVAGLASLIVAELLVGLWAGFAASLVFALVQVAGQITDTEMGFGMMNVLDPINGVSVPLMGSFLYLLSLLIYLGIDGHHSALLAIVRSYETVPAGAISLSRLSVETIVEKFAEVFALGVQTALGVIVAMFLASVAMGVVARAIPQINIFVMGLPIKVVLGALVLGLSMPVFAGAFESILRENAGWFHRIFATLASM